MNYYYYLYQYYMVNLCRQYWCSNFVKIMPSIMTVIRSIDCQWCQNRASADQGHILHVTVMHALPRVLLFF